MKPKIYEILMDCIDRGLEYGYNRAHKHTDSPDKNTIISEMSDAIVNNIFEYFNFEADADSQLDYIVTSIKDAITQLKDHNLDYS